MPPPPISAKLRDDTRRIPGDAPITPKYDQYFFKEMESISQCAINRPDSSLWFEKLKFICFEDGDSDNGQNTTNRDKAVPRDYKGKKVADGEASSEHEERSTGDARCICECTPLFRTDQKEKKFRVVRASTLAETFQLEKGKCQHYVAVSYCWPKNENGIGVSDTPGSYQVQYLDEDGTTCQRLSKAPDEVLERAFEFAEAVGARLIWIDQECLPQDDSEEHFLGIDSMDILYEGARWTIGLVDDFELARSDLCMLSEMLEVHYTPGSQLRLSDKSLPEGDTAILSDDELQHLVETDPAAYDRHGRMVVQHYFEALRQFLSRLLSASWSTRAWIFQEVFSAGSKAILIFKTKHGTEFQPPFGLLKYEQALAHRFLITMSDMNTFLRASKIVLESLRPIIHGGDCIEDEALADVIDRLEVFYPYPSLLATTARPHTSPLSAHEKAGNSRPACNAAAAMTFLSGRENSVVCDRIAIVGNLCKYGTRLDALKVQQKSSSLTTCILVLSILNGDLSLLTPETYFPSGEHTCEDGPSWMLPIHRIIPNVRAAYRRSALAHYQRRSKRHIIHDASLSVPGYLWKVDRSIDFSQIQAKYADIWEHFKSLQSMSCPGLPRTRPISQTSPGDATSAPPGDDKWTVEEHEGQDQYQRRTFDVSHSQEAFEMFSMIYSDDVRARVNTRKIALSKGFHDDERRSIVAEIFFSILRDLCVTHNVLLAESIWHSIRAEYVLSPSSENLNSEYLHVVDALNHFCNPVRKPHTAIDADGYSSGDFFQLWIIERIMRTGKLWVGNYIRSPLVDIFSWEDSVRYTSSTGNLVAYGRYGRFPYMEHTQLPIKHSDYSPYWMPRMAQKESSRPRYDSSNTHKMSTVRPFEWKPMAEDARSSLVSAFDVDGPCTVLTPYDSDVESLPRQERRGMAVCWVVEVIESGFTGRFEGPALPADEPEDMFVLYLPLTVRITPDRKMEPTEDKVRVTRERLKFWKAPNDKMENFRVLKRVKGAWAAMDEPIQEYRLF